MERRIVITGIGTINPLGNTVFEYWDNLVKGKSGGRTLRNHDLSDYSIRIGAEVDLPDNMRDYFSSKKMIKRLDRYIQLGTIAGRQAVTDSGLEVEDAPDRYGVIMGNGGGGLDTHYDNIGRIYNRGISTVSPFYIVSSITNTGSAFLSQECNLQGPSFGLSSACATSNHAIGVAAALIQLGMADAMFAGGTEAVANRPSIAAFGNIMALSARNDSPETASRPFDRGRDGFLMGEGAGMLCLEELEHAKKRGAKIYAELTGFGFTSDAHDLVAPHPDGRGASRAIRIAMEMAGVAPDEIDLINCHGTSTPTGDKAECVAINAAFGKERAESIPAHSTKSMIGHLIGAAGAVEAIAVLLAFERGTIHRTINQFERDPEINLNIVTETVSDAKVQHALSNGFGFGGHNASIILSRFSG
jgi:3-oxoacyl-[acyl-carrier-protein] synthase II